MLSIDKYGIRLIAVILFIIFVCLNANAYETRRFRDCIFSNIQNGDGLLEPKVKAFLKDRRGFMWLVTPSALQKFDGTQITAYVFDDGVRHSINCVIEKADGSLLAGGGMGLWKVDSEKKILIRFAPELKAKINALSEFGDKILACAEEGLYLIEPTGEYKQISDTTFTKIIVEDSTRAYLLDDEGIFRLTGDKIESIGNSGIKAEFTSMSDSGRTILIGTDGMGIFGFDKITNCLHPLYKAGNNRITTIDSNNDKIVVGTKGSGVSIIDKKVGQTELSFTSHPDEEGRRLLDDDVAAVMIDDQGIIWIGYDSYVGADYIQYHNKPFRLFDGDGKIPYELAYFKCHVDDTGKKFSTVYGTYICDSKGIRFEKDVVSTDRVDEVIKVIEDSVTFIGKDNRGRDMKVVRKKDAYVFDEKLERPRRICTPENDHFLGINIEKILQDANNNYWVVGSRGAIKVNPELTTYTLFSTTEGLTEPYASDAMILRDTLWVTTPHGVYFMDINVSPYPFNTLLTEIYVNGQPVLSKYESSILEGRVIEFKEDENNIEFNFVTLSYDNPYKMLYEYKFEKEGEDKAASSKESWTTLRGINHVVFKNLDPGKYTFTVRKQMDNERAIVVRFEVAGRSSFFYWILSVVFLASTVGLIWFIRRRIKKSDEKEISIAEPKFEMSEIPSASEEAPEKYKYNNLSDKDADEITSRLKEYMEINKAYVNPELKLNDVAKSLGVTPQVLSQTLNTKMNIRFNDYINQLRIKDFKKGLETADKSKFTLESLASQCGFNSYSTCIRAFKKTEGVTPNDYMKTIH